MPDRAMTAEMLAELGLSQNQPIHLMEARMDSGTVRYTDAPVAVTWNGNTYTAAGDLIAFDGVKEDSQASITKTTVTLSGVTRDSLALLLNENYVDRRLLIWKTFINSSGNVLEPELIFDGRIDRPAVKEDVASGTCAISVEASSHFADFERVPGRKSNTNSQELFYPADTFFDFASQIPGQLSSIWGRPPNV